MGNCSFTLGNSLGGNLSNDNSCGLNPPEAQGTDQPNTDPQLGPLADNGGPTQTHALLPGSPAIDAAADAGVTTDQRGVSRPQGAGFDIGAFELELPHPPPADTTPPSCTVEVNNSQQAIVRVQDSGSGLADIGSRRAVNATVHVPSFARGAALVRVTIQKRRLNLPAVVSLQATDVAGNTVRCRPVLLHR